MLHAACGGVYEVAGEINVGPSSIIMGIPLAHKV